MTEFVKDLQYARQDSNPRKNWLQCCPFKSVDLTVEKMSTQHPPFWETGFPCSELVRTLKEDIHSRGTAIELGSGCGANAVFLAEQGFDVTAIDCSERAIRLTREAAESKGLHVNALWGDVCGENSLTGPIDFVFDRYCYQSVRLYNLTGFVRTLGRILGETTHYLLLVGNATEPSCEFPPCVQRETLERELGGLCSFKRIRPFRFDRRPEGRARLGWSCLLTRRQM